MARVDGSGRIDLKTGTVSRPVERMALGVERGRPGGDSFATRVFSRDVVPPDED